MGFPIDGFGTQLMHQYSDVFDQDELGSIFNNEIYCKKCGTSLSQFLNSGFVGCSDCYKFFKNRAIELAGNVHGRINHVGKVPKTESSKASKKRELERLIAEKDKAIIAEDYLRANDLKRKIQQLREELK